MLPSTLSASAIHVFETCEARFKATYIDRARDIQNDAASLGSAVHEVLELWIKTEQHKVDWPDIVAKEAAIKRVWDIVYPTYFTDTSFYADGWAMIRKWVQQTDFTEKDVLSTEAKKSFEIPTSAGPIIFNYIIDRLDQNYDGSIEVVDYKSVRQPIPHDRMPHLTQVRCYAVAARIEFPHADKIWVTYDLLRFTPVSVAFDRDECVQVWKYLKRVTERILASDGTRETLNPECRFCVRKHECKTLQSNQDAGGILSIGTLEEASNRLGKLTFLKGGIDQAISELQEAILTMAENDGVYEWETDEVDVKITAKGRRTVDHGRAAQVLGPTIMAKYGKVGVGDIEEILKTEDLTSGQRSQLKQLMKKQFGAPYVVVKPRIDDGD